MYFSFTQIWDLGTEKGRKSCNISSSQSILPCSQGKAPTQGTAITEPGRLLHAMGTAPNSHSTVPSSHQQSPAHPAEENTQLRSQQCHGREEK